MDYKDDVLTKPVKTLTLDADQATSALINGLNALIHQASVAQLGPATRILHQAKEELVHWAVEMDYHESPKEKYINYHMYHCGLQALGEIIARISTMENNSAKGEITRLLGDALISVSAK